jgi:hypothetical protein
VAREGKVRLSKARPSFERESVIREGKARLVKARRG